MSTYSRTNPFLAKIKERALLSGSSSSKKVYHVVIDTCGAEIAFKVGDSIAVFPTNQIALVDQILHKLNRTGQEIIFDARSQSNISFRDFLLTKANLHKVSFHKLFDVEKTALPLLELVEHHKPSPEEICPILLPLMPRFYSIASSPKVFPNEIHLTIAHVSYIIDGQMQFGVGSHFLCEEAVIEATPIPIYVQSSNHFTLPERPETPILLIGPGTGIAPFRAFLQERLATQAGGLNWVFFGERNRASDFYYSNFWLDLEKQGFVRLSLAFSRDQTEKIYVQHRLFEERKSVWDWIEKGCHIYVCGDAEKMAKDVDATLQKIIHLEGGLNEEDARKFLKNLRAEKRYLLDVY
jgi:sulfite reductase (NADPH) flavoprotein alpha-component